MGGICYNCCHQFSRMEELPESQLCTQLNHSAELVAAFVSYANHHTYLRGEHSSWSCCTAWFASTQDHTEQHRCNQGLLTSKLP